MTITVNVTREDIDNGKRGRTENCALALAFNRLFPQYEAQVTNEIVHLFYPKTVDVAMTLYLPEVASKFIVLFDNDSFEGFHSSLEPFSFEVEYEAT